MHAWIQQTAEKVGSLFDRLRWKSRLDDVPLPEDEVLETIYGQGLRVSVTGPCRCCGDQSFLIEFHADDGTWVPMAFVKQAQLKEVMKLLVQANNVIHPDQLGWMTIG